MKNIKQFQNGICQDQTMDAHIQKLIKTVEKNDDNLDVFFSGMISSYFSTLLSMILVNSDWVDKVWIRVVAVFAVFALTWLIVSKFVLPLIKRLKSASRVTYTAGLPSSEIIDFFRSRIVLTTLELKDALSIVTDTTQDSVCRKSSALIATLEYAKCINYISANVKNEHIRIEGQKEQKLAQNYINEYILVLVYEILYNVGKQLVAYFSDFESSDSESSLVIYDLEKMIECFKEHRNKLGLSAIDFEHRQNIL